MSNQVPDQNALMIQMLMDRMNVPQAPAGAVTGQGVRNWWPVISACVLAFVAVIGWTIKASSDGTETLTTIKATLADHTKAIEEFKKRNEEQQSINRDVKEVQGTVGDIKGQLSSIQSDVRALDGIVRQVISKK